MAAATQQDWHAEAVELRGQGLSERQIAEAVNKAPSTVHDFLKSLETGEETTTIDTARLNEAAGITADRAEATPGQRSFDGSEVQDTPPLEEIRVDGTAQLGMFDAGGKRPQSASLRLSGGKILLVDGQAFRKGDVIRGEFTAVVREVGQRDKPDPQTGIVVSAEQKHVAQITDLTIN